MPIMTELIKLTGTIIAKTKDATLWQPEYSSREVWIPKSAISKEVRSFLGKDEIYVTAWMAKKLGLT